MGVELAVVDAAFYLIFVGAAAVCVGIIGLAGFALPESGQLLVFRGIGRRIDGAVPREAL